jgi:hypothetical protein
MGKRELVVPFDRASLLATWPANAMAVLVVSCRRLVAGVPNPISVSAGWTQVAQVAASAGALTYGMRCGAFYRMLTGTDANPVVTLDAGFGCAAQIHVYAGVSGIEAPFVAVQEDIAAGINTPTYATTTTAGPNRRAVHVSTFSNQVIATVATPWTRRTNAVYGGVSLVCQDVPVPTAGSTPSGSFPINVAVAAVCKVVFGLTPV